MDHGPDYSEEARSDGTYEEDEALAGPTTDPNVIESRVSEQVEGDLAVVYPSDPHHGTVPHDDVDGSDAEAIYEDESREIDRLELEMEDGQESPPDLVDLHDAHAEGDGGRDLA